MGGRRSREGLKGHTGAAGGTAGTPWREAPGCEAIFIPLKVSYSTQISFGARFLKAQHKQCTALLRSCCLGNGQEVEQWLNY